MSKKQERSNIWYPGETPVKVNNKTLGINIDLNECNEDSKFSFLNKEFGGVLLNQEILQNRSADIIRSNIETKSTALLSSILNKDIIIDDPYVLGKYYSNLLNDEHITQYYTQNGDNIDNYLLSCFPKLQEEETCLKELQSAYGCKIKSTLGSKYTKNLGALYGDALSEQDLTDKKKAPLYKEVKEIYGEDLLKELVKLYNNDAVSRASIIDNNINKVYYFLDHIIEDENKALLEIINNDLFSKINAFSPDNSAIKFLTDVKIIKKLTRALTKISLGNNIQDSIDINYRISTALKNNNKFLLIVKSISEHVKIYKSGSISEETYGITGDVKNYEIIGDKLVCLSKKIDLSQGLKNSMQGKAQNTLGWGELSSQEQDHLYELTFFIIGLETTRNSGNLISVPMFFDLVQNGVYKVSDIADKLPMSMKGAVPCSLKVDEMLGMIYGSDTGLLSTHHYYDYRTKINGATKDQMDEFLYRDKQLFIDWIVHQKMQIDHKLKFNDTKLAKVYFENIGCNTNIENDDLVILKNNYAIKIIFGKGSYSYELLSFPAKAIAELIIDWYGIDNVEHFPKDNINLVPYGSLEKYFSKNISIELFSNNEDQDTPIEDTVLGKRKKANIDKKESAKKRKINDSFDDEQVIDFNDEFNDSSDDEDLYMLENQSDLSDIAQMYVSGDVETSFDY